MAKSIPSLITHESADLCVVGGNPAGVTAAVRAAREGLSVVLISYHLRVGGVVVNGMGTWDTNYRGFRAPI